jgi:2-dehydropantoate 2-reductase
MFRHAGIPCEVADNLERAHWEKLVWNIPFNGLGVAGTAGYGAFASPESGIRNPGPLDSVLPTDRLLCDPRWETLVRELMMEIISVANAKGLKVNPKLADTQIERTRLMGAYKASTLLDFERGLPLEMESLFLSPLRQARDSGVLTPRLEVLCQVLTQLDHASGNSE